jgi:spore germination protein KC
MRKSLLLLCCFVFLFSLSGCWDYKELNQVAIITGMAIDKGEKRRYRLTVEKLDSMELSPQQSSGNTPTVVHSLEGNSIPEIAQRMNVGLSKKMIFSHMRTAVISDKVAKKGIMQFFDYLERYREIREDFNVVIAKDVPASDILKVSYPIQKASTLKLHMQLGNAYDEWGSDPDVRKKDIIASWTSEGRQPVVALVTIRGNPKKGNSVDNMKLLAPAAIVELVGMGVFKNEKLIGNLSVYDTRNYLWTQNKIKVTELSIPCEKNKSVSVRVFRSNTKVKARVQRQIPHFSIHIDTEAQLTGSQCAEDMDKTKTYDELEKVTQKYIENIVASTIKKVQTTYKSDIFGFGDEMKHGDYQYYKKVRGHWDQEFSRATIDVKASVTLRRSGIRTKSFLSEIK